MLDNCFKDLKTKKIIIRILPTPNSGVYSHQAAV